MGVSGSFLLKVLGLSTALALAIKFWAPSFNISPSAIAALIMVLTPTLVLSAILIWRLKATQ